MVEAKNENIKQSNTRVGEQVLLKREHMSKMQLPFYKDPFTVTEVKGSMLTLRSGDGLVFKRNVHHTKLFLLLLVIMLQVNRRWL